MPRNTAMFAPTFSGMEVVRSNDIRQDPRYGQNAPHRGMPAGHLPVVSYLAVPVISSSGDVLGGLFFGHDAPGMFEAETETLISAIAGQAAVAIDNARLHRAAQAEILQRKQAEDAKELLLHEIKHRVKNTLATVQAIASQTFRGAPPEETDAFVARLHALSGAHDLLTQQSWELVDAGQVVRRALLPFSEHDHHRFRITGQDVPLDAGKALLLAMALHELGTNAVKYGALSRAGGRIDVCWELVEAAEACSKLRFRWQETGGPPVRPPARKGFGSRMIERALQGHQGAAYFDFAPQGLVVTLEMAV